MPLMMPSLSSTTSSAQVQCPALLEAHLLSLGKDTDEAILSTIWAISFGVTTQPLRKGDVPEQYTSKCQYPKACKR